VLAMIDDLAERISTVGGVPSGLPGRLVQDRSWNDYDLDRADALAHLGALDLVYQGVIADHRAAIDLVAVVDKISEDLLIGQTGILERYHWFVRSHLEDFAGGMANAGATTEADAARAVTAKQRSPRRSKS
jgi:starvation-inducible DNA-binding protein